MEMGEENPTCGQHTHTPRIGGQQIGRDGGARGADP